MSFFNVFYRNSTRHWLYEFTVDGVEYNYWGGGKTGETIEVDGKIYTAIAIKHGPIKVSDDMEKAEFKITLPFDSGLAQNEWRGNERSITHVKIIKYQDEVKKYRALGRLYDVTYNDETFDLMFNQGVAEGEIKGNHLLYQKNCPYAVFSEQCGLDREDWKVRTTIKSVDGLTVVVRDAVGLGDGYFDLGMLWYSDLAKSESIDVQVGDQLTLIRRFDSLADCIISDTNLMNAEALVSANQSSVDDATQALEDADTALINAQNALNLLQPSDDSYEDAVLVVAQKTLERDQAVTQLSDAQNDLQQSIDAIPYVYLLPGCLGGVVMCAEKFNNIPNYGGQPFTPSDNPSGKSIV